MLGKKTGGRKKGTPNKNNPIKQYLIDHSTAYFEPTCKVDQTLADSLSPADEDAPKLTAKQLAAKLGVNVGDMVSRFDLDTAALPAAIRVDAEIKILNYHQAKMQNTAIDMTLSDDTTRTIEQRLIDLAAANE